MRVLMFGWEFPPHISGGLGTACYGLTQGLMDNNVEVLFVVPKAFGDEDTSKFRIIGASEVPVHTRYSSFKLLRETLTVWEVNSLVVPYLTPEEFERYSWEKENFTQVAEASVFTRQFEFTGKYGKDLMNEVYHYGLVAAEIADANTFDIIHAHDWLSFPAGMIAKKVSGKPLIVHIHATEFDRSGDNINKHIYDIEREGMQAADKIIAVSDFTKQTIVNKYHIDPNKIVTIHNAVVENAVVETEKKVETTEKQFDEKIVSYLGRITFQKGPEYFVAAAAKVLSMDKNFRFVMAGSGDMLHRMIKLAARYRISSHFHFTGFLKGAEVDQVFAMSDVYVMPSVSEPFGISPLEAIRSNVPVVISKQSGVSEILKHAIKVDFWDTDAMANAIYALAKFKGLSAMFIREGQQEMNSLKWDIQARKVKELYEQVIAS